MTTRKIYTGGNGPYLFDDTNLVNDQDGDFAGQTRDAIVTDGDLTTDGSLSCTDLYLGDPSVDGTWKFVVDGNYLLVQRREGGTFVTKGRFTP